MVEKRSPLKTEPGSYEHFINLLCSCGQVVTVQVKKVITDSDDSRLVEDLFADRYPPVSLCSACGETVRPGVSICYYDSGLDMAFLVVPLQMGSQVIDELIGHLRFVQGSSVVGRSTPVALLSPRPVAGVPGLNRALSHYGRRLSGGALGAGAAAAASGAGAEAGTGSASPCGVTCGSELRGGAGPFGLPGGRGGGRSDRGVGQGAWGDDRDSWASFEQAWTGGGGASPARGARGGAGVVDAREDQVKSRVNDLFAWELPVAAPVSTVAPAPGSVLHPLEVEVIDDHVLLGHKDRVFAPQPTPSRVGLSGKGGLAGGPGGLGRQAKGDQSGPPVDRTVIGDQAGMASPDQEAAALGAAAGGVGAGPGAGVTGVQSAEPIEAVVVIDTPPAGERAAGFGELAKPAPSVSAPPEDVFTKASGKQVQEEEKDQWSSSLDQAWALDTELDVPTLTSSSTIKSSLNDAMAPFAMDSPREPVGDVRGGVPGGGGGGGGGGGLGASARGGVEPVTGLEEGSVGTAGATGVAAAGVAAGSGALADEAGWVDTFVPEERVPFGRPSREVRPSREPEVRAGLQPKAASPGRVQPARTAATGTPARVLEPIPTPAGGPSMTELDDGWNLDDHILEPEEGEGGPGAAPVPTAEEFSRPVSMPGQEQGGRVPPPRYQRPAGGGAGGAGATPAPVSAFAAAPEREPGIMTNIADGTFKLDRGQVKLAFKGDWEQMEEALTAPLDLLLQLHVVDQGPVVVFLIGIPLLGGELREVTHLVVDPFRRDVKEMLQTLRTRFHLEVEFFDRRGRSRRSVSFDKRLEVNTDEILRVIDQFGVRTPSNGAAAVAMVNNPRFNRLGAGFIDGAFNLDDYTNLNSPAKVGSALEKLDFWLDSTNLDYLFFIKSQSAEEFREVLSSVLNGAIGYGMAMSDPMKGLAVDLGFATDLAELNNMQVASFTDVFQHLKPNDLDQDAEMKNWDALFSDAEKANIRIDPQVLEMLNNLNHQGERPQGVVQGGGPGASVDNGWDFGVESGDHDVAPAPEVGGGADGAGSDEGWDELWHTAGQPVATSWEDLSSPREHRVDGAQTGVTDPGRAVRGRPSLDEILVQIESGDHMWDTGMMLIGEGAHYLDELVGRLRVDQGFHQSHVKVLALILAGLEEERRSDVGWELRRDHDRKIREVARKANSLLYEQGDGVPGRGSDRDEELLARVLASGDGESGFGGVGSSGGGGGDAPVDDSLNSEFDAIFQGWTMLEDEIHP